MKSKISLLALFFISISFIGCNQHDSVDDYMQKLFAEGKFNGNVLVVKNGETIYEKSLGYVDPSRKEMLTKDHRFGIGSVYKEFPAVAIMQLQEKGILEVDDTIDKYLPSLPNWASEVTILNLLQYTSGLPKVEWEKYMENDELITHKKIMDDVRSYGELKFKPGKDYLYTNYSPILLIKVVESLISESFSDYVRKYIFAPTKMDGAILPEVLPFVDRTRIAIPYNLDNVVDSYRAEMPGVMFCTTPRDLYSWMDHLHAGKVLNRNSIKQLSQKANFWGNVQAPFGRVRWKGDRIKEHFHHGENGSYECVVRRFDDGNDVLTIVVMSNQKRETVIDISDEIKGIVD